jgi:putative ABC transport system permease protein
MIGIITYVSVIERTKEIGIMRSIGARKKDISRIFNAETLLIGLGSGILGIGIYYLLQGPVNAIINNLIDIPGFAGLPLYYAVALILLSSLLTITAGLIPARIAAKKDPVVALRTE